MEFEVIDKYFGEYTNSIYIRGIVEGKKMNYDIQVKFRGMKICVDGVGVKTSRQREYKYINASDNYSYRKLDFDERKEYMKNYYLKNIPKEVLNLALETFYKEISIENFD